MEKLNILLIYTDQMHKFALNCMGTEDIITPNLDKLAEEGVLFRNAYTNCPICSPFRINLTTGLYAHQTTSRLNNTMRNGCKIPKSCITLPQVFNDAGYRTSFIGKWHVGGRGNKPIPKKLRGGFQDFIGYQCMNGFDPSTGLVKFYDEDLNEHQYNKHRTDVTADLAIERMEEIKDDPFLMVVGFQAPHYPEEPSPKYEKMYKGAKIKRRKNIEEIDPYTPTYSPWSPRPVKKCPNFQKYGGDLDEYLRLYYALCTQIDANVGRIINRLKELNIYDNTIIFFTSDHGDMQGSHGMKNKTKPYEESAGIPLIIKVPEGAKGVICKDPVSVVDFFPTCVEYAGIDLSKYEKLNLPGQSLAPFTKGESQDLTLPAFSEMKNWKMIREGNLKLVVRRNKWKRNLIAKELYDLENDPYEMTNFINNERYQEKIVDLEQKIQQWLELDKCKRFRIFRK